jgi:hypothetical protein
MHKGWHWHDIVANDPRVIEMVKHLGAKVRVGRADGVFMTRALFDEMLKLVYRYFDPVELSDADRIYPFEEVLFPTLLPVLLGSTARIAPTRARVWEGSDPPTVSTIRSAISSGLHASGKRIPQALGHPVRSVVLSNLPGNLLLRAKLGTTVA